MGIGKLGISLAQKTTSWLKASGKTSILQHKPVEAIKIDGLHYSPGFPCDTFQITNNFYLSETFIKSLTKIKGKDNIDTARKIKDSILYRMGYKNPEYLKLGKNHLSSVFSEQLEIGGNYNAERGEILLAQKILDLPKEELIPFLYHELDHMDKFVKLYKGIGEESFYTLISKMNKESFFAKVLAKKGFSYNTTINFDFYKNMSQNIDISDFNIKKWHKAVSEYPGLSPLLSDKYKYVNNPLEVSAYNVQSKVQKILGLPTETARDAFPQNYKTMISKLKNQGITSVKEQEKIIEHIYTICGMKNMDDKLIGLYSKKINGIELTSEEWEYINKVISKAKSDKKYSSVDFIQKCYLETESYIDKKLLTEKEIIEHL